jgi:hypothetical protein
VPVPCFLHFLCFRKATHEIFSELDETKTQTPIFPGRRTRTEREPEGGPEGSLTLGWRALPLAHAALILQLRRRHRRISGDRSLCSGTPPGRGSAPGAISIGLNCCHHRLHRPHRHLHRCCYLRWWGGSSSPPGLRTLPVAMWFTSLSHDVIFMWSWALYLVELVDAIIQILCYSRALLL